MIIGLNFFKNQYEERLLISDFILFYKLTFKKKKMIQQDHLFIYQQNKFYE